MSNRHRKSIPLAPQLTLMIVILLLVTAVPIGVFAFIIYRGDSISRHGERAVAIVQSLALAIDPNEFLWAIENNEKNDYYLHLQQQFDRAKGDLGASFLFAGIADSDQGLITFMEALLPHESYTADLNAIVPADRFPIQFFNAQRNGVAAYSDTISSGVDDTFVIAAYAPIFNKNGSVAGVVGVTIDIRDVLVSSNSFARTMALIVLGVIFVLIWIPILSIRSFIGKPLTLLCEASDKIANGYMDTYIPIKSNDEIGDLAHYFRIMQSEISTVISETRKKSEDIIHGNLSAEKITYTAKGDFQKIIESVDNVAVNVHQYLDDLSCAIVIFDDEFRFKFINGYARGQGYDPAFLLGKTIYDVMPPGEAEGLGNIFKSVSNSGKAFRHQVDMVSPKGEPFNTDQLIIPIRDNSGKITTFLVFGYEITELVQAQKRFEKINAYQECETEKITHALETDLAKGILDFSFELDSHDSDTEKSAQSYVKIRDAMTDVTKTIKSYVDEITMLLREIANSNYDIKITREYIGDFGSIKDSIGLIINSVSMLVEEIQSSSSEVEQGAGLITQYSHELKNSFSDQSAAVEEVRAAVNSLTEKTQKNAEDAGSANNLSEKVQEAANAGAKYMEDMSEA
ncbi:MAG: PAS domain-containing protein, partial [Clostridiales bacterium]|nr:PAS domain-containing protein [Clostridiales bacterium]